MYLAVLTLFPKKFNISKFKTQIEREIHKQTGLSADIENLSVKTSLSPYINLNAHHVVLLYPDKKELLKVSDLNLKVRVIPIVFKKIQIENISVNRPVLSFSVDNNGNTTLDKYLSMKFNAVSSFAGFKITSGIPNIELNRYKIKIYDKRFSKPFVAEGDKFRAEPLKNDRIKLSAKGILKYNETPHINFNSEAETFLPSQNKKIFESNPFYYIKKFELKGDVISKFSVTKSADKTKITGDTDITKLSYVLDNKKSENNYLKLKINDNKIFVDADLKSGIKDRIQISGTVQNTSNPYVNLKCFAKDLDLKNFSDMINAVFSAFNIQNKFSEYTLSGKANFDFKIKGNKSSIRSEGIAEIINAAVSGKDIPYSVNGINSKISFADDNIKIADSQILINSTPLIFSGQIDRKTNMDILVKGENLSAEKLSALFLPSEITKDNSFIGYLDFNTQLKGNFKKPKTAILLKLKDFIYKNKGKTLISFANGNINLTGSVNEPEGVIEFTKANILPAEFSNKLKSDKLTLNLANNTVTIPENILLTDGAPLKVSGKISDIKNSPVYDINFDGRIKSSEIYSLLKQNFKGNLMLAPKGAISAKGNISGKGSDTSLKAEIYADKDNYLSGIVIKELLNQPSVTYLDASLNKNDITVKNLSLNKANAEKIITLNGKINDFKKPVLKDFKVLIPKSMTFALSSLKNSEITVTSDMLINGDAQKPEIQGNLDVKNIVVPEYKLRSLENNIVFEKNNIKLNIPKLEIGKSQFDVSANLNPDFENKVSVKDVLFRADTFDLDEINATFAEMSTETVYPGVRIPLMIPEGKAIIKIFKTGGVQAENINCDFTLRDNVLTMKNIKGTAYNGSVTGKSEYNFLTTVTTSEISGSNADLNKLLNALTGKNDKTTGLIDYKLKMKTIGTQQFQQIRTAKGYLEFTAKNGVLGPLGQFEHFLYAQNLISQSLLKTTVLNVSKAVKPQNTGVFTTAKGKIEIVNGNAYLKPVTVEGPKMSLYITGKNNVLSDMLDVQIYGRISQDVEKVLGELTNPVPKTILSKSSETSLGNLFYDEYNTTVSKAITDAIPQLNPNMNIPTRPFMVVILGSPDNVKAVKSFKWIVSEALAPTPNTREIQNQTNQNTEKQEITEPKVSQPSFLDNLPDNFE